MRKIIDNNRGQGMVFGILALVLVAVLIGGGVWVANSGVGDTRDPAQKCSDSTGTLTISPVSALTGASDPSPSYTCGVNGDKVKTAVTSGTTTFAIGDELDCLANASNYLDVEFTTTMVCGGVTEQVEMFLSTSDNPAITIRDPNNGDATLSDLIGGGAINLTNPSAGSTIDFDVEFKGTNTESSGVGVYVLEFPANSGANITDVTMGGLKKVSVPTLHQLQNAGSEAVAFEVPAIEGAVKKEYSVVASFTTTGDIGGGVYTDWYAQQAFIDDDGFIKVGVEDSDGTAKHENTLDYDFFITG